jgi:bifunctional pyridoxal-dependent enzyme with beta-cystathionase and maltose regulon repressor activities
MENPLSITAAQAAYALGDEWLLVFPQIENHLKG